MILIVRNNYEFYKQSFKYQMNAGELEVMLNITPKSANLC